ncbi:Rieske (2Fe-2S) protein [Actinomycetospora termitidis]|uniref:Rieske 2Fe-2S domain-containing protein n=1 Tax=Actinomycetospora termitidis TaxID=3053470 RepID=A0ABT7MCV8_9PSEU|nr:Rieske 2Fe-2S domain-containing protein [Actinomycetospora sp. Odt1-22]MDL5158506.1 Rieske 2Fe-2S domain-containing protein [Actinomycetospora sp. Odt1-22]
MLVPLGDPAGRSAWTVESPDGRQFAVFLLDDGSVRVSDAGCPHRGGPLVEGRVRDGEVRCPWHWYRFDLDTGECRTTDQHHLAVHPVVERDGELDADVGDPPPVLSWSERLRAHAQGDS